MLRALHLEIVYDLKPRKGIFAKPITWKLESLNSGNISQMEIMEDFGKNADERHAHSILLENVYKFNQNLIKYNNGWLRATIQKLDIQNLKLLKPEEATNEIVCRSERMPKNTVHSGINIM